MNAEPVRLTPHLIAKALDGLVDDATPIRLEFGDGARLHIDRPLPFLCVHVGTRRSAAAQVASSNAAYLLATAPAEARNIIELIARRMSTCCGSFLAVEFAELAEDRFLTDDAPFLQPFEIALASGDTNAEKVAQRTFSTAASEREAKYRTPRVEELKSSGTSDDLFTGKTAHVAHLTVRFAPIYKARGSGRIYPALRDLVVANMVDSSLQAIHAFMKASQVEAPSTHRSLGRRAFIDAVTRADRSISDVAQSFDFLLSVTPINSEPTWLDFQACHFEQVPKLLYRPLEFEVSTQKRKLYSIPLDQLEDPLLTELLSEKRQELDLQLSMIGARETSRFVELSRALYGGVEPELAALARSMLESTHRHAEELPQSGLGAGAVAAAAREMIAHYHSIYPEFDASVEIRADLPAGLLVSKNKLLISTNTKVPLNRLTALLSHEVGVHLLTYLNGNLQGLTILRDGLAGYEGMQEGLAVLAEYLAGGMTVSRMRLIAARVVCCQAMLDGASFVEAFRMLRDTCNLNGSSAFNVALRIYRGGGLTKDAIYLRGVMQVLHHLKNGGSLTPFWIGKISASHFTAIQDLSARGLLRPPRIEPAFLSSETARPRLRKAMAGIGPLDMLPN